MSVPIRLVRICALLLCGMLVSAAIAADDAVPDNSLYIRNFAFDRGNVTPHAVGEGYADTEAVVINGYVYPNVMEYDIDFPVSATYTYYAKYAALQSRPVDLYLDGAKVHHGHASTTGSWSASSAKWEKQCELEIEKGKHTIKLLCPAGCIPHLVAFRLDSSKPFPPGWKLERPNANKLDGLASLDLAEGQDGFCAFVGEDGFVNAPKGYNPMIPFKRLPPPTPMAHRVLEYGLMGEGRYDVQAEVGKAGDGWVAHLSVVVGQGRVEKADLALSEEHLRKMLGHTRKLMARFRDDKGPRYLAKERAQVEAATVTLGKLLQEPDSPAKWQRFYELYVQVYRLKNRVALSNPLLRFGSLAFAKRYTYNTSHIYTTYFDGSRRPGGQLCVLDSLRPDAKPRAIATELGDEGIFRDPDVSWDGQRVLFSWKKDLATPCHLYEVNVDGTGLRQLTDSEYDDIDPCYLPDGRLMFVSTRCRRVVLCHNAFTVSVLYTMNADGNDIRCISPNTVNDFTPSVTSHGEVVYTRWEYVDKHLGNNQALWKLHADGSRAAHIAGAHWGPITFWEPRQVPGSDRIACTLAPHMPLAVGPIVLVDPADMCASPAKYENLTPEIPAPHHFGWYRDDVGYYCGPYPLSEDFYLVSYSYAKDPRDPKGYGLYLLDRWNNRELIYRDPDWSCFEAFPVASRQRPAVAPPAGGREAAVGRFFLQDVYQGLPGIEPGEVKYLRVVREVAKPVSANCSGFGLQYPVISNGGHNAVKELLGTVPVEPDGSAYFEVPVEEPLYFSALDKDYMELQRMRSFTYAKAGESISCVGCHEHRTSAPSAAGDPAAFHRAASKITPPPGGAHGPDFPYDVQPVLDKHCASCHTGTAPKGGIDLSSDRTQLFNVAYETLTDKQRYVRFVNVRESENLPLRPPKYYGSHASKLVEVLRTTHKDRVKLSRDEFRAIVTWIDCNAPYYGTYRFSRPGTLGGRELISAAMRKPLDDLYKRRCQSCHGEQGQERIRKVRYPSIERSPALLAALAKEAGGTQACGEAVFKDRSDPDLQKMLEVLNGIGQEAKAHPRMDMLAQRPPLVDPEAPYRYR